MSSIDLAVQAFTNITAEDIKVLMAIEQTMNRYKYTPLETITAYSSLPDKEVEYRLKKLNDLGLLFRITSPYIGYSLSTAGYDCLAINSLVKGDVIKALGRTVGVGKESDVYDALTPKDERVIIKFHRLGRTSFKQTRRLRDYVKDRRRVSWLLQSRLAAEKEYRALKIVCSCEVSAPKPLWQNRHAVVMEMIHGEELFEFAEVPKPRNILKEILDNVKKTYCEAGIIHGDLSEFNVIVKDDGHISIIDWPQYVTVKHPNADSLLKRDVYNILKFFNRKYNVKMDLKRTLRFIKEEK